MLHAVRKVAPGDRVEWLALFRDYIRFYQASVPDDVIALTWERVLAGDDSFCGLVAVDASDRLLGLATMVFHRSTWSPTNYCYLEDLFVDARLRGGGIGRALILAVYDEADARQCTRTYWATKQDNREARRLYDTLARCEDFVQYRR